LQAVPARWQHMHTHSLFHALIYSHYIMSSDTATYGTDAGQRSQSRQKVVALM
jgi:hypothetical protein